MLVIDSTGTVQPTSFFFFQAEDGIRDLVRSRGLGDVYKRQLGGQPAARARCRSRIAHGRRLRLRREVPREVSGLSLIHI